jgi:hypothetical protein
MVCPTGSFFTSLAPSAKNLKAQGDESHSLLWDRPAEPRMSGKHLLELTMAGLQRLINIAGDADQLVRIELAELLPMKFQVELDCGITSALT